MPTPEKAIEDAIVAITLDRAGLYGDPFFYRAISRRHPAHRCRSGPVASSTAQGEGTDYALIASYVRARARERPTFRTPTHGTRR